MMFKLSFYLAAFMFLCVNAPTFAASKAYEAGLKAYNQRDFRTAYGYFELALKEAPADLNTLYYDALALHQLRLPDAARKRYQQIIDTDPTSAAAELARKAISTLASASPAASSKNSARTTATNAPSNAHDSEPSGTDDPELASLPDTASFYFTKEPGGHMAVDLMVNGHPVKAWFDTGADAFFYKDQLMQSGVDCNKSVAAGYTQGWAGKKVAVAEMPAVIRLGTLTRRLNITMEESSTSLAKNLIGQSFIRGYQYEIDDNGGRVDLRKVGAAAERLDPMYDIPCTLTGSRDIVDLQINGRKVQAFIDTGSAFTIIDKNTATSCGVESTGSQEMSGVGGNLTVGTGNANIRFGPISREFMVRIGGNAGTCIGQDFMQGWRFKIDRKRGLLRFFH